MNRWLVLDTLFSPTLFALSWLGRQIARAFEWAGGDVDWEGGDPPPPRWLRGHLIGQTIRLGWCVPLYAKALYWHLMATSARIDVRL